MRSALSALLLSLAWSAPALAFHGQMDFRKAAMDGGGGGMYFTGSARFRGYDCTICHQDPPRRMFLLLDTEPADLVQVQEYEPEQTYRIVVTMQNEHRGLSTMLNPNSFVLEILDASGEPAGLFSGFSGNAERPPGEELAIAKGEQAAQTEWSFDWTAPAAGAGVVSLHLAGVDGDGAGDRLERSGDPFNDDVFVGRIDLGERGGPQPAMSEVGDGCGVARSGKTRPPPGWLVALLLLAGARRRKPPPA